MDAIFLYVLLLKSEFYTFRVLKQVHFFSPPQKKMFKPRNIQGDSYSKSKEQGIDEISNGLKRSSLVQNQFEQPKSEQKLTSVHERVRIPVTYDDNLLEGGIPKE